MEWIAFLAFPLTVLILFGAGKVKLAREPDREGTEDQGVVEAYDRLSHSLIMIVERRLALGEISHLNPKGILVDAGCGPGYIVHAVANQFPGLRVIGLDINRDMLEKAVANFQDQHKIQFVKGDVQLMPFPDNEIDFVLSTGAFHHWREGSRALQEFHRVLKPGGQFIVLDLRRDMRRWLFWAVRLIQLFMPPDIKRVNGAVGSVWSSYTIPEMKLLLKNSPLSQWQVKPQPGWMFITGKKEEAAEVN